MNVEKCERNIKIEIEIEILSLQQRNEENIVWCHNQTIIQRSVFQKLANSGNEETESVQK